MAYLKTLLVIAISTINWFYSLPVSASDYGTTGLVDIPTARMETDGVLTATSAIQSRTNSYAISYQPTPWLETTFRYTGFNRFFYYDRNYEAKVRLWSETEYLPQVAVGIRDMVGTGVFGSEYIVANKYWKNFDFTLGLGWGRLAGSGDFDNPFGTIFSEFKSRENDFGEGGELSANTFFKGEKAGVFGGLQYQFNSLPISMMVEYNPDDYEWEVRRGGRKPKTHWTAGMKWEPKPGLSILLSRQTGQEWGMTVSAALDTKHLPKRRSTSKFVSSLDMTDDDLPSMLDPSSWYDTLLFDVERSGLLLLEASIDETSGTASLVIANAEFPVWADAIARMSILADLHMPRSINSMRLVLEEAGHRVHSVQIRRPSLLSRQTRDLMERQIKVMPGRQLNYVQYKTGFVQNKVKFDVNLGTRFQLFDPDDPMRYQLFGKIGINLVLPANWSVNGYYAIDIKNNFDSIKRNSDSVLPRVRSDIVKYLKEGDSGLDSLYLEKRGTTLKEFHYRVYAGVLEEMYSGFGGEILFQPFQSRIASGFSANWVRQRDYDRSLKHLDYETTTAFASIYWASPFYNMDIALHAGKYLAKDMGATMEVRRTFNNGWMVGLWATMTDVPFEDFGEGSFDKGIFFKMPLDGLFGRRNKASYSNRLRPIQRDGGQRLENFSGNIWWDIRAARYDALYNLTDRMLP